MSRRSDDSICAGVPSFHGESQPELTVSCIALAYVLATLTIAICVSFAAVLLLKFVGVLLKGNPWQEWIAFPAAILVVLGITGLVAWIYIFRLAVRVEFGFKVVIRTFLTRREVGWSEIGQFQLLDTESIRDYLPWLMPIRIMLTDGSKVWFLTSTAQAETALALVRSKPWAKEWRGAPWGRALPLVAIVLGVFIAAAGIVISTILEKNQMFFLAAGLLIGIFAIGYGTYHLVVRPIYYRANVGRSSGNGIAELSDKRSGNP